MVCIQQLFEAQVERTPEAVAVIAPAATAHTPPTQLTYSQLNRHANQLAHYLQKLGVGPETPIGLCLDRSTEMIVALLGILKAGGAYVPLDPAYPAERLVFMLADTQASVMLTQASLQSLWSEQAITTLCLDTDWEIVAQESEANPATQVDADNLAYIMYTSGSTGQPKGVMIEHHSLAGYAKTAQLQYELRSTDRIMQFSSISFDISVEEIFPALR
jgi:non-ribosomal peptide synthetase component F